MGPKAAISSSLSKFATFSGRATTSEFWWSYAAFSLATYVAFLSNPYAWLVVKVILLVPTNAVAVRRMNDQNKSGWLIVAVGILLFIFGALTPSFETFQHTDPQQVTLLVTYFALMIFGFWLLIGESTPQTQKRHPNPNEVPQ